MEQFNRAYMNIIFWKNKDGTNKEEPVTWKVKDGSLSIKNTDEQSSCVDIMTNQGNQLSFLLFPDSIGVILWLKGRKEPVHIATLFTDGTMIADGLDAYTQPDGKTLIEPNDEETE